MIGRLINTVADLTLQPVRDTVDVLQGLTEGEIRTKAVARLGADVAVGMSTAALIEYLGEQ